MDDQTKEAVEAGTFRRLVAHLQEHTEVQNIDLMILADFCRNCLSKWYSAEAQARGVDLDYDGARTEIYGMPYSDWKSAYQMPATAEQLEALASKKSG